MKLGAAIQKLATSLLGTIALATAVQVKAMPVQTEAGACSAVKARIAAKRHFPISAVAFCDIIPLSESPRGYYVLALHSKRQCDGICSTNMGWFAINERTGRVFEFNVGDWKLGPPVSGRR